MVVGWILWVFVFAITTTPEESELVVEPFQGASLIFGVLTGLIICFGLKYNVMHKAQQATKAAFSNISVFEERAEKNQKLVYNQSVEEYNTLIHSFPASLLRKLVTLKMQSFIRMQRKIWFQMKH